jgi:hypothetical protein
MTLFQRMKDQSIVINDEVVLTVIEGTRCGWGSSIPRT